MHNCRRRPDRCRLVHSGGSEFFQRLHRDGLQYRGDCSHCRWYMYRRDSEFVQQLHDHDLRDNDHRADTDWHLRGRRADRR